MSGHAQSSRLVSRLLSPVPVAIAHRGGSRLRPENTLVAFARARELGVDALECDVHLSRDGEPVVIDDATLDRTTDATGPVAALTADELAGLDAAYGFAPAEGFPHRGRGVGVPRLTDLLAMSAGLPLVVEIKGADPRTADRVVDVVLAAGAEDRVVFAGFSDAVLSAVRRRSASLVTGASQREVRAALRRSYVWLSPRRSGFDLFQVPLRLRNRRVLTRAFVRVVRRSGIPVQAWIVDDVAEMRLLLAWGVSGLISDRPDLAVAEVRAFRGTPEGLDPAR